MKTNGLAVALLSLTALLGAAGLRAQSQTPGSGFTTSTTAVVVDVVVRDAKGAPIVDLKPGDFELFEDEIKQKIASVELIAPGRGTAPAPASAPGPAAPAEPGRVTGPSSPKTTAGGPTVMALVFHRLSAEGRALAQRAADAYLKTAAFTDDYVGVFLIDASLERIQTFTTDRQKLAAAIERATSTPGLTFTRNQAMSTYYGDNSPDVSPTAGAESAGRPLGQSGFVPALPRNMVPLGNSGMADKLLMELAQNMENTFEEMMRDRNGHAESAALISLATSMGSLPGRKAMVLFSEGVSMPTAAAAKFRAVIDTANRGNVSIYAVDAKGLKVQSEQATTARGIAALRGVGNDDQTPDAVRDRELRHSLTNDLERNEFVLNKDPEANLGILAKETGGFLVNNTNDLVSAFQRIDADRRFHYLLTYTSTNASMDGSYRHIAVTVKRRNADVRARSGYVALPMLGTVPVLRFESNALSALAASPRPTQVPMRAAALQFPEPAGRTRVALYVTVPGSGVAYFVDDNQTAWQTHFTILARIVDDKGETIRKGSQPYRMTGPAKDVHVARQGDILFYRQPTLDAGRYTVDYALYDELSGQAGTGALPLQVDARDPKALAMSSLVLVDHAEAVPEDQKDTTNPLYLGTTLIYPNLGTPIVRSKRGSLVFYYTARGGKAPLSGRVELVQDRQVVASRALAPPTADATGLVQQANELPLTDIGAGPYELRVMLTDGATTVTRTTGFTLLP